MLSPYGSMVDMRTLPEYTSVHTPPSGAVVCDSRLPSQVKVVVLAFWSVWEVIRPLVS